MTTVAATSSLEIDGHEVALTNQDKVLYPASGFTKGEVVAHYRRVAPVLLPYLADRPLTLKRFPDGVEGPHFFEKHAPRGTPDWVRRAKITIGEGTTVDSVLGGDEATLVWLANLASLELHAPMWRHPHIGEPDLVVFDLDPGAPATAVDCCAVALRLREQMVDMGLTPVAKSSGSKGIHVLAGIEGATSDEVTEWAHALADELAAETPDTVVARMTKSAREAKVFIDWSQNRAAKTTVAPYSLRGRDEPWVSTPLTWDEVEACREPDDVLFGPEEVAERLDTLGDLCVALFEQRECLPAAEG
ncbi:MAG TPA: non-homologous end-joining DNA ligase [Acidimicrobiales bacterium]|nr:non-homologous end-joining DNA ligase [Acidimicrobiales bacterium]